MNTLLHRLTQHLFKQLIIYWVFLTVFVSIGCLYLNWQYSINRFNQLLARNAEFISKNIDRFIEDLLQELYALPVYGNHPSDCKKKIRPFLEHILINHPKISGIIVTNSKNQLVCSNLPNVKLTIPQELTTRSMTGPYRLAIFEQPIYKIKQKIGDYQIRVVILSSELENILAPLDNTPDSIVLYNHKENKKIISIHHANPKKNQANEARFFDDSAPYLVATEKLHSIHGLEILVFEKQSTIHYQLWINQIIATIILLILSYLLYLAAKKSFNHHYSLLTAMKLALKNHQFYPVYQPVFDQVNQRHSGVEVLLRWHEQQDEIIMPDFFIEEAEKTGLIVPITLNIINIAFEELHEFLKTHSYFHLAFNLSALHFTNESFFNTFYGLMNQYDISPQQIILEITERDLLNKNDHVFVNKMTKLIKSGYSLAVDDYGTGHASISYIQNFPFNYLKIDQIFVQAIGTHAINESLIDTIISMAKKLKLSIIAEGVETHEQMIYLIKNQVQFLQGWYFSKALTKDQLIELIEEKNHA